MEEVDKIILHSLSGVGCEFADEIFSLKEMTTENVVEGAVKCIRIVNDDFKMSPVFPPGMSARFRVGTSIAQACQNLGYRGEIGYQTLLYSSEVDVRKLFMFLVEKLPRKEGIKEDTGSASVLQRRIGQVLREQGSKLWLPSYCFAPHSNFVPFRTQTLTIPKYQKDKETTTPYVHQQISDSNFFIPSLLELNVKQYHTTSKQPSSKTKQNVSRESYQWKQQSLLQEKIPLTSSFDDVIRLVSGEGEQSKQSRFVHTQKLQTVQTLPNLTNSRPIIPRKPQHLQSSNYGKDQEQNVNKQNHNEAIHENHVEKIKEVELSDEQRFEETESKLLEEIERKETECVKYQKKMQKMETSIKQMKIEIGELEVSTEEAEKKIVVQQKTCQLLPNAEENMEKLQKLIEKNQQRIVSLGKMWEERRLPMINEIKEFKEKTELSEDNTEIKLEEIKLIRKRMKEATEETKRKEQMIKQLSTELESMKRDISRQSYTKRIHEIVSSIHKQQEEIGRVISEIKDVQKQINKMKGRIDRTFTAVDEVMFKDARKNENIRQAYKYLVSLHDGCTELLRTVEETGAILREVRELEDQIDTESQKNAEENLKKIMKDYKEIKRENAEMIKAIRKQ
uniref:Coiled-coil domain-containing protein 22 n=1 Tax=Phallusia mammillata TaxID=59560 RepID=A0A6F9D941_9ASCI|nr:coiled-coil domain-containing protein 22 homolog [Phallusia mammillata]